MTEEQEIQAIKEWLGPVDMEAVLAQATIPAQAQAVESVSAAAMAYGREQHDYEMVVNAWRVYVLARRRTTELILETQERNMLVTDLPSFTRMQWHRRMKEYQIEAEKLNAYFDECVSNGWNPSIAGLLKATGGGESGGGQSELTYLRNVANAARQLVEHWESLDHAAPPEPGEGIAHLNYMTALSIALEAK